MLISDPSFLLISENGVLKGLILPPEMKAALEFEPLDIVIPQGVTSLAIGCAAKKN